MEQTLLHMVRGTAVCDNGHRFTVHSFPDLLYGLKEATTSDPSDFAYVDALRDPVCDELSQLLDDLRCGAGKHPLEKTRCFDLVLPFACDPAPSGQWYSFTATHWCPVCKSTRVDIYEGNPYILDEIRLPHITHQAWQRLNAVDKRELVQSILLKGGCL